MQLNLAAGRPEETLSKLYPVEQTESHPAPSKWKTCNTRQWTNFGDKSDYNHGQNSWDTFAFLGPFPIHTGPTLPSPHKRCWMRVSRIFSEFQLCIEWGRENCKKISKRMHCFNREPLNDRTIWILLYCPKDKTVKWKYLVWDVPKSTFYSRLDFTLTRLSWSLGLNVYWISFPFLLLREKETRDASDLLDLG